MLFTFSVLPCPALHPFHLLQEIPGVAGLQSGVEYKQFRLQRAQVELNPVFATTMHMADHQWGYVRLVSFSQHAPADMHRAISQLKVGLAGTGAWVGSSKAESRWFILLLHTHTRSATSPRCLPAFPASLPAA